MLTPPRFRMGRCFLIRKQGLGVLGLQVRRCRRRTAIFLTRCRCHLRACRSVGWNLTPVTLSLLATVLRNSIGFRRPMMVGQRLSSIPPACRSRRWFLNRWVRRWLLMVSGSYLYPVRFLLVVAYCCNTILKHDIIIIAMFLMQLVSKSNGYDIYF